jgi:hypothetical protein
MAPAALRIEQDDLSGEATRALLALHLSGMHRSSPPGQVFALDVSGLQQPNVTVWTAWDGHSIAGMGALKLLGGGIGEVKSMRIPTILARESDQRCSSGLSAKRNRGAAIGSASKRAPVPRSIRHWLYTASGGSLPEQSSVNTKRATSANSCIWI